MANKSATYRTEGSAALKVSDTPVKHEASIIDFGYVQHSRISSTVNQRYKVSHTSRLLDSIKSDPLLGSIGKAPKARKVTPYEHKIMTRCFAATFLFALAVIFIGS